jgi:hypothetical protein
MLVAGLPGHNPDRSRGNEAPKVLLVVTLSPWHRANGWYDCRSLEVLTWDTQD